MLRKIWLIGRYCIYLLLVVIALLEIILRIYNPLPNRISKGKLILSANRTYYQRNGEYGIPGLDSIIKTTINSLGFRGPEKPAQYEQQLTIFTVGGSTTFCLFLNDDKTWPFLLQQNLSKSFDKIWLNNAGINGQSTNGHLILLNEYVLPQKPKVIIFLIGLNDIDRTFLLKDSDHLKGEGSRSLSVFLSKNSELYNLYSTITGALNVKRFNFPLPNVDFRKTRFESLIISDSEITRRLALEADMLEGYKTRVSKIIKLCKSNSVFPIFITQPLLIGPAYDSLLKVDLSTIKLNDSTNSLYYWRKLSMYNEALKTICLKDSITVVDLAASLPKSSLYFWDIMHYTNAGAAKIDSIIAPPIIEALKKRFPEFYRGR